MGMDVYGLNPVILGVKPEIDWANSTEEEREQYNKDLDNWENNNPGFYFRANLWSWRPIHLVINSVITMKELDYDTSLFGENSGGGFKTQEECDNIADGIDEIINELEIKDKDTLYLNLGMWISWDGKFEIPDDIQEELNAETKKDFVSGPIVASNGQLVVPAHSVDIDHLKEFVNFLRHCGGFEIW